MNFSKFQISEGHELPFLTRIDEWDDLTGHPLYMIFVVTALILLVTVPFFHLYFWTVVRSARRRMMMEIAIDYDENFRIVKREEAQREIAAAVVAHHRQAQLFEMK